MEQNKVDAEHSLIKPKTLEEVRSMIREHKRNADSCELPPDSNGPLGYLLEAKRKAR